MTIKTNKLKLTIRILLSILLFIGAVYLSVLYSSEYRKIIRWLFEFLSHKQITFHHPAKYFHFGRSPFVFSIAFFLVVVFNLSYRLTKKQVVLNTMCSLLLFSICTLVYSELNWQYLILECTICDDGLRTINYHDIHYDLIMMLSLLFASIPWMISEIKLRRRKRKNLNQYE